MITNINLIKGVGKFSSCNSGGITLLNKVLIFGKNTKGKSTLTSILTSLKQKNNDLIVGRKTFGFTDSQNIVIKANDKNFIFQNNEWNNSLPELEIFDTKFITDNVCNTEDISFQQQQNLNGVILGDTGKNILQKIKELTDKINQIGVQKREITNFFSQVIQQNLSLEDFSVLEKDENIDIKIKEKESEIEQMNNKVALLKKIDESFFKFNFDTFEKNLQSEVTVDYNSIEEHMKKHSINTPIGKKFLQEGSSLSNTESCLFCGQEFNESAKSLIESYKKVFTTKFVELQKKIIKTIEEFSNINFEDKVKNDKLELQKLGLTLELTDEQITFIFGLKNKFAEKLIAKKEDLTVKIDFENDQYWNSLKRFFSEIVIKLEDEKKQLSGMKDIPKVKKELILLNLTKKRFEDEIKEKVLNFEKLNKQTTELQSERDLKSTELETYAVDIFNKYRDKINLYLNELNANFTLDNFSHLKKLRGQDEFLFTIRFESAPNISPYICEQNQPSFRNTLSESDKRTLAFAFFLSKLSLDSNLDKKIVVFDDPISSFDKERKRKTKHLLIDVNCDGKKPQQIIVLTHQEDFLKEISRELDSFNQNYTTLKIDSGVIKLVSNINKEFPDDEILSKLETLKQLLESETIDINFFGDYRIILENVMKRKYFEKLSTILSTNPRASIRTYGETIYSEGEFKTKFIRLCNDIQIPLHDNQIPDPSDGDKKSILQDFFSILKEI